MYAPRLTVRPKREKTCAECAGVIPAGALATAAHELDQDGEPGAAVLLCGVCYTVDDVPAPIAGDGQAALDTAAGRATTAALLIEQTNDGTTVSGDDHPTDPPPVAAVSSVSTDPPPDALPPVATATTPGGLTFASLGAELDRLAAREAQLLTDLEEAQQAKARAEEEAANAGGIPPAAQRPAPAPDVDPYHAARVPAVDSRWRRTEVDDALDLLLSHRLPVLLTGDPGTGKDQAIAQAAARAGRPVWTAQCSDGLTERDLIGGQAEQPDGSLAWTDGVILAGWRAGEVIQLSEVGALVPSIAASIHDPASALASQRQATYTIPRDGVTVTPTVNPWLTATSNILGADNAGRHVHEALMSPAFCDRFVVLKLGHGTQKDQAALLAARCPWYTPRTPKATAADSWLLAGWAPTSAKEARVLINAVAGLLGDCRASAASGALTQDYGPRAGFRLLTLAGLMAGSMHGRSLMWRGAILDRHTQPEAAIIQGHIQRRFEGTPWALPC